MCIQHVYVYAPHTHTHTPERRTSPFVTFWHGELGQYKYTSVVDEWKMASMKAQVSEWMIARRWVVCVYVYECM